jgi:hypothetical protein
VATEKTRSLNFWLTLYTMVSFTNVLVSGGRYLILYFGGLNAANRLHESK